VLLFTHPSMLGHAGLSGHPERPERLASVLAALEDLTLDRREAPFAQRSDVERVHPAPYIEAVKVAFPAPGAPLVMLDADTYLNEHSREAVWRAPGACVAAVDAVLGGDAETAFCAVRPPGHHAEPLQAMGFCIFSNVAIAAKRALDVHGLHKVAVVDFDVHHGNGTQSVAEKEPRLFFASTHQSPLYPGTGRAEETGPANNVLNAPLPPGADGAAWRRAMEMQVLPALEAFAPDLVFISAGFDAHRDDPLASMELTEADFAWGTRAIREAARGSAKGRIVSTLEGGYDLSALGRSARAHVDALL
jgi:acetoin utilization deacetylase AcuC-like enzyme